MVSGVWRWDVCGHQRGGKGVFASQGKKTKNFHPLILPSLKSLQLLVIKSKVVPLVRGKRLSPNISCLEI